MGFLDGIEKLINEHGSATILRERIALANDKHAALELKVSDLEAENKALRFDKAELQKQISNLENRFGNNASIGHNERLDDIKEKILIYLINGMKQEDEVVTHMGIKAEVLRFHLEKLSSLLFVKVENVGGFFTSCTLLQEGREYLINNNLV